MIRQTANTFPLLRRQITNKLVEELLSGWVQDGKTIRIDLADDASGLVFETVREDEAVEV